jgi:hypothetical protein
VIAESTVGAPLAGALRAWAGERRVVPAKGATVLILGPLAECAPRFRLIPGGIVGASFAIDAQPDQDPGSVDLRALTGVRLVQSEWLLDSTFDRLRRRESAGRPLVAHGHIRLRLSEAAVHLAYAASAADVPGAEEHAHRAISRADGILAELHGGSSVLTGSPGHLARFSALLALAFAGVM